MKELMKRKLVILGYGLALAVAAHHSVAEPTVTPSPSATNALAEQSKAPETEGAICWRSKDGTLQVFLVGQGTFRLVVIGADDVEVTYHTAINTAEKVNQVLVPVAAPFRGVKEFKFQHGFSRTTIWMALEFRRAGRPLPDLARTFYGSTDRVVPNDYIPNTWWKKASE